MTTLTAPTEATLDQEAKWIDDAFRVESTKWGTWNSFDKEGKQLVTSLTEEICKNATRFYLKGAQEGFTDSGAKYDRQVGGKL
jgi:hypothetical protein